jgi:hypothetical protein
MPDNYQGLARGTGIGIRLSGETSGCVIDEIAGDERVVIRPLTLADEFIGEDEDTFSVVSSEGTPDESDLPEPPGILKIGNELLVYNDASIVGNTLQFTGCVRGVMHTDPGSYDRGTRVEPMFGIVVGMLSEGASDTSNALIGIGFDRFPRMGVVRLEDPEAEQVELRLYTTNVDEGLMMPINDLGGGIFNGRYGTVTRSFDTNTPVFWHPVRAWDRYAEFSDNPELSYWSFTTQLTDAFIKRIYWKEGQLADNVNVRVYCRLNEGVDWNAPGGSLIYLSRDAGQGESSAMDADLDMRRKRAGNPLAFLYGMDNPRADNMIEVQADKVEVRFFTIYNPGAFNWDDPSVIGWKFTPRLEAFAIEYVQQNRTRRHVDR